MSRSIPIPVLAVAAQVLEPHLTHAEIDTLMQSLGIPGLPPIGSKLEKLRGWLKNANQDPDSRSDPLAKLGKVLEEFMEVDPQLMTTTLINGKERIQAKLREHGLEYAKGGLIVSSNEDGIEAPKPVIRPMIPTGRADLAQNLNLQNPTNVQLPKPSKEKHAIFIGHGHSGAWRELKDFIVDRLHQEYEEFNREATAGISTKERLEAMLKNADFAFLVMTAEDERRDGKLYARDNVIHEAGLFQGRLGFKRAIILLEEGCEDFSNIDGLTHIPFAKGRIATVFEEVRRVLEREGIIKG